MPPSKFWHPFNVFKGTGIKLFAKIDHANLITLGLFSVLRCFLQEGFYMFSCDIMGCGGPFFMVCLM